MEHAMADEQPSPAEWRRLESKVDLLTEAINKLVLIDERQIIQGQRLGALEQRIAELEGTVKTLERTMENSISKVDRKVDMWINRGIGVWAVVGVLAAAYQLWHKSP
jgi:hypothetical protein